MDINDLTEVQLAELNKRFDAVRDPNNPYGTLPEEVINDIKQKYFDELSQPQAAVEVKAVEVQAKPTKEVVNNG